MEGSHFRHNRVLFVQNQGAVLKKSSLRGVHPGDFPSRQGGNERRPISCAHSSWIKRSTLLCPKMTRVHPVVSFPHFFTSAYYVRIQSINQSINHCAVLKAFFSRNVFLLLSKPGFPLHFFSEPIHDETGNEYSVVSVLVYIIQ